MKKILRVFKGLFKRKKKREIVYICDPARAYNCSKDGCWFIDHGPCRCTLHKDYAKLDEKGKPVLATDADIFNTDFYDYWISVQNSDSQKKQGL